MGRSAVLSFASCVLLAACVQAPEGTSGLQPAPVEPPVSASVASKNFAEVVARVEPVAEQVCREKTGGANCDFRIVTDPDASAAPNAYQSLDKNGRPVITFTKSLIAEARNADELAFVMGHEAAHHIRGHIPKQQQTAVVGALILGGLVSMNGGDATMVDNATRIGASVGARAFSQEMELQADALGTQISYRAGYDPVRGAAFFNRIPDPGVTFLGSHPPNAARQAKVAEVAARL